MFMRFVLLSCFCEYLFFMASNDGCMNMRRQRDGSLDAHFDSITEREKLKKEKRLSLCSVSE